jgi:hypothetical protein
MNVIEIDINIKLLRKFMQNVINCEYGISSSLIQELDKYKKNLHDLTDAEVEELSAKAFTSPPIYILYNLEDDNGNLLLPIIYNDFYNGSENKELFSLGKYGIQCIDLYNIKGKLIYKDAYWIDFHTDYYVEIMEQSSKIKIFRYRPTEGDLEFLGEPRENILARLISFNESRFYFNRGFVDENFKATTPMCFDNGKYFNEDLAPVCLNGKWGYINKNSEVVINFIFGDAEPFENGIAKVFVLKPEYQLEKGLWLDGNVIDGYTPDKFLELFPKFPKKKRIPFCFFRENSKTMEQLNKEYHYYAEGVGNDYGFWTQINTKGEIIDGSNSETTDQPKSNLEDLNNNTLDKEYWFNYIIENSGEYWIVSKLPDSLFIDKPFVLSILERFPNLYSNFRVQYSDDSDISELAFNFSFRNFDFFSERIKVLYQERYDKMLNEEGKKLFDTNITLAGLDDDLPF